MPEKSTSCFSTQELENFRNGELSQSRYEHSKQCILCSAALDGIALSDLSEQQSFLSGDFMPDFEAEDFANLPGEAKVLSLNNRRWLIAASFIAAVSWATFQYNFNSQNTGIQEFSVQEPMSYVEQPFKRQMRSSGITTDMYGNAAGAFQENNLNESIQLYQKAINTAPTELLRTRGFYEIGIVYWKADQFDQATDYLTKARLGEADYYEDATWALAQLYRQIGYLEEAKLLYQDLAKITNSPHSPRAKYILEKIRD